LIWFKRGHVSTKKSAAFMRCRAFLFVYFFDDAQLPGVARRPVTFFASPKKVTQKRRPQPLALRASQCCIAKNGKRTKLACGSDNVHFFIHFRQRITGSVPSG
jgi:hypothetical protein